MNLSEDCSLQCGVEPWLHFVLAQLHSTQDEEDNSWAEVNQAGKRNTLNFFTVLLF